MNSKQASIYFAVSYGQFNYLLRKVDGITPVNWGASMGKAREFTPHDLTRMSLALILKEDGLTTKVIQKAITELNKNWNGETAESAGELLMFSDDGFTWYSGKLELSGEGGSMALASYTTIPKFYYNVRKIAGEFYGNETL